MTLDSIAFQEISREFVLAYISTICGTAGKAMAKKEVKLTKHFIKVIRN